MTQPTVQAVAAEPFQYEVVVAGAGSPGANGVYTYNGKHWTKKVNLDGGASRIPWEISHHGKLVRDRPDNPGEKAEEGRVWYIWKMTDTDRNRGNRYYDNTQPRREDAPPTHGWHTMSRGKEPPPELCFRKLDWKRLLDEGGLGKYKQAIAELEYDMLDWPDLTDEELKQHLHFQPGAIKRWRRLITRIPKRYRISTTPAYAGTTPATPMDEETKTGVEDGTKSPASPSLSDSIPQSPTSIANERQEIMLTLRKVSQNLTNKINVADARLAAAEQKQTDALAAANRKIERYEGRNLKSLTKVELHKLQEQIKKTEEAIQKALADLAICKICMEKRAVVIFLPCKHQCACKECSISLKKCPMDRTIIEDRFEPFQ